MRLTLYYEVQVSGVSNGIITYELLGPLRAKIELPLWFARWLTRLRDRLRRAWHRALGEAVVPPWSRV